MEECLYLKFTQHEELLHELVATHPSHIVWTNKQDSFFGMGAMGQGHNELGHLLVRLRERLKMEGAL